MTTAKWLKLFHIIMTILWVIMVPVTLLTGLKNSVPFVVFLSIYALIGFHVEGWQTARVEHKNDER
jgi:Ni/Fe-hydrogenase subunit HybB-like protein